ncbi:RNA-binding protein [Candidatus Micrarchaeota archaeon]|nr:RNA-binding protein [Candidatus Micrarchaeota archaeon]
MRNGTMKACTSCGRTTEDFTAFPCPKCGQKELVRCKACRENVNAYSCTECGFEGP